MVCLEFQIFLISVCWLFDFILIGGTRNCFESLCDKRYLKETPFFKYQFTKTVLWTYIIIFLRRFWPKIFLKVNIFCQKFPFSKKNSFGAKSQHSLKLASCGFHKQTQRSFTKGVPIASLVIFFNVLKSSFFRRKLSTTPVRENPSSRRFCDFCILLLCKSFCNLNFQNCLVKSLQILRLSVCWLLHFMLGRGKGNYVQRFAHPHVNFHNKHFFKRYKFFQISRLFRVINF